MNHHSTSFVFIAGMFTVTVLKLEYRPAENVRTRSNPSALLQKDLLFLSVSSFAYFLVFLVYY